MIPLKAIFLISVLISGMIFSPSYSFAQNNQNDSPLSSLFEIFRQLFSFGGEPDEITEFGGATVIQTSGTSSTSDTTDSNILPKANAGPDQDVLEFSTVTLDGSSSTDVDGNIVSYQWTQNSDPPVQLSSTSKINPTFVAPEVKSDDLSLRFTLKVTDNSGGTAYDEVNITVKNVNIPPKANAGPDQNVLEFTSVTLDGSSSTDVDGTIVSYKWIQSGGTSVSLSSLSDITPTFTAPDVDSEEILKFILTVKDNSGSSSDDDVEITIKEIVDGTNDDGTNDDGTNDDGTNDDGTHDTINIQSDDEEKNDNDKKTKVTLCHVPPGNSNNPHTIIVGESAVDTHLAHGDSLGSCDEKQNENEKNSNSGKGNKNIDDDKNEKANSNKGNSGVDNSANDNQNNNQNEKQKKSTLEKENKKDKKN